MDNTIDALKNLYVAMGGNEEDVADLSITPDMINAIAAIQCQGGGKKYQHNIYIYVSSNYPLTFQIINDDNAAMTYDTILQYLKDHTDITLAPSTRKYLPASGAIYNETDGLRIIYAVGYQTGAYFTYSCYGATGGNYNSTIANTAPIVDNVIEI